MDILKNLLCAVGVIVFTVGLCALFNRILVLTVRPKCGEKAFTVVMLDDEMKSPAAVISYYQSVYSSSGGMGQMKIVCVNRGLQEHSLELLKEIFSRDKHIVFVDEAEFFGKLSENKVK